jgi:type I restriction enzyme, S subunit
MPERDVAVEPSMIIECAQIVQRVAGLFVLADQLELRLAKARARVDQLTPYLPPSHGYGGTGLARAFAGKLVPQDSNDEPAEKLLERIKAHHESKSHRDAR